MSQANDGRIMRASLALVVVLALLAGCADAPAPAGAPTPTAQPTAVAPVTSTPLEAPPAKEARWTVTDETGREWTDQSLSGQPAVLFFMATWCSSCRQTAPRLANLHDEFGGRAQFLSVDFDPSETKGDIDGWKERYKQPWPHALDPKREVQRAYAVNVQSTVVVLEEDGSVAFKAYAPGEAAMREAIQKALA